MAILKDCTLELRSFYFDGAGINVQVYLAKYPDWEGSSVSISSNLVRDQPYADVTLAFTLPPNLPDFDAVSIWCVPFGVSFGDGLFAAPEMSSMPPPSPLPPPSPSPMPPPSPLPPPSPSPPLSPVDSPPGCNRTHPMVGYKAKLKNLSSHGVGGAAMIVDGCTIGIRDFDFDGSGLDVQVYLGSAKDNFATGFSISGNLVRDTPYSQAMISLMLPEDPAAFSELSIWCVTFGVDFGSGTFMHPSSLLPPPSPPLSSPPSPSC